MRSNVRLTGAGQEEVSLLQELSEVCSIGVFLVSMDGDTKIIRGVAKSVGINEKKQRPSTNRFSELSKSLFATM